MLRQQLTRLLGCRPLQDMGMLQNTARMMTSPAAGPENVAPSPVPPTEAAARTVADWPLDAPIGSDFSGGAVASTITPQIPIEDVTNMFGNVPRVSSNAEQQATGSPAKPMQTQVPPAVAGAAQQVVASVANVASTAAAAAAAAAEAAARVAQVIGQAAASAPGMEAPTAGLQGLGRLAGAPESATMHAAPPNMRTTTANSPSPTVGQDRGSTTGTGGSGGSSSSTQQPLSDAPPPGSRPPGADRPDVGPCQKPRGNYVGKVDPVSPSQVPTGDETAARVSEDVSDASVNYGASS